MNLTTFPEYEQEYHSARRNYYSADGLEKFSRDWLPNDSYKELLDLQQKISDAIILRKQQKKASLKHQLEELAANSGFDLGELMGTLPPERKRKKVATKYRRPKDSTLKWTGRGRKPLWLVAELEKGRKLESFLIK